MEVQIKEVIDWVRNTYNNIEITPNMISLFIDDFLVYKGINKKWDKITVTKDQSKLNISFKN